MLRIKGFEGKSVEQVDDAVVEWQKLLKETEQDKVLQIVSCNLHIREAEPEVPVMLSIVYALQPRHPHNKQILIPAQSNG